MKYQMILLSAAVSMLSAFAFAQDGNRVEPKDGQTAKSVLSEIQTRVNNVQTMKADMEFDRKESDEKLKRKKKENKPKNPNPAWPEPDGREVERGPLEISRGVGAKVVLQRKKDQQLYVANTSSLWKYDAKDKEAQHIPTNWPVIDTFVSSAYNINVFAAMDDDSIKFRGTESVDGVTCWVVDGKSPSKLSLVGVAQTKLKIWVGKADGIPRLIKVPSEKDTIIRIKNLKLNEPIDASEYQFTPPEGVETKNIFGF